MIFPSSVAGSLPKPSWLAEPNKLWPQWKLSGDELAQAKLDATLLAVKLQEDAGIDIVCDGEMSRQHFVHGFLEFVDGIDFAHKVEMGIRDDRYKAMVPVVRGELTLKGRVHAGGDAPRPRPYQAQTEDHAAGPDDHRRHHRRRPLRRQGENGDGLRRLAEPGSARARSRRRRRHPVRRAGLQRVHGRGARLGHRGAASRHRRAQMHDRRAHLLRLRHQGQYRLEEFARRRVEAIREDFSRRWPRAASTRSRSNASIRACR